MKKSRRIGILGGAFDPIHLGHLALAKICCDELSLDEVRFIPCKIPLLKQASTAKPWQRAAMVALAIVNHKKFFLDTRELTRAEPSYALLTLQSLQQDFPGAELFFLMGEDAYQDFHQWHQWEEILKLCKLAVVSRDCHPERSKGSYTDARSFTALRMTDAVIHITMPLIDIASCDVRADVNQRLQDLPESVKDYILENKLYL